MIQDLTETKSLPTFCIDFATAFSLNLYQQNNTQNHGTTVWDSAKLLAFYLFDSLKRPEFDISGEIKQKKKCIELGSGCGLGGIMMAALGFDTVVTDLAEVVERVLTVNSEAAMDNIRDWWYHLDSRTVSDPQLCVEPLDWLKLCERMDGKNDHYCGWLEPPYHYILAADCIYNIELVVPLLRCIDYLSSHTTVILIAMERRDDFVVDGFINKAKSLGFDAKMVVKKILRSKLVENEDVEIWKLKKRRRKRG
ncbi:hypothetical protein K501DRAFT_335623 [Backusella circina FSU 941]|nr:hypothetical protein K501DRAFT_335623 [Backusella circina FSU 941]